MGLTLLVCQDQRWKLPWVVLAGALIGAWAWAVFHWLSDGMFTQVLPLLG